MDRKALKAMAFIAFQDRCLKPLGHPSGARVAGLLAKSCRQRKPNWHRPAGLASPSAGIRLLARALRRHEHAAAALLASPAFGADRAVSAVMEIFGIEAGVA